MRKKETNGKRIITYCAGCSNFMGSFAPTSHILDLMFEPEATMAGKVKISKAPFTYLNRLRLKHQLKSMANGSITRERMFTASGKSKKAGLAKRLLFLLTLISVISAIRFTGAAACLEQNALHELIQAYGATASL